MESLKDKLYNYKADPPEEIWDSINAALDAPETKIVSMVQLRRKSKSIFYGITAAASLIIIFLVSVISNQFKDHKDGQNYSSEIKSKNLMQQKIQDSFRLNNKILDEIIASKKDGLLAQNFENLSGNIKKYITISGPEGQPVKISPKVATLIESADNEFPPKPVWSQKIQKWKKIMESTTISPTSTTLLDIVQAPTSYDNNDN